MWNIDIDAFKKEGFSFEEIQKISNSINSFDQKWITHSHNEVKKLARKEIFANTKTNV